MSLSRLERVNEILGIPIATPLDETIAHVNELKAKAEAASHPSAGVILAALAGMKIDAAGGRLSAREALQLAARDNPQIVAEWRRSFRQDGSAATYLSSASEAERSAALASRKGASR
jgi:hypothetical protein